MTAEKMAEVVERRVPASDHVELVLQSPELAAAVPGQFAHVLTPGILRRPISFSRLDPERGQAALMFQIVGSGTAWLAGVQPGQHLNVLGPLGRGFPVPDPQRPWCLVGGGVGIPPLYAALARWGNQTPGTPAAILGARTAAWVLMADDFRQAGAKVTVTTDDGSRGEPGTVIGPWLRWMADHPDGQVYACGPTAMLARMAELVPPGMPAAFALEQRMGCGIGACLACVVPARSPNGVAYRRVCTEGPVFDAHDLCLFSAKEC